MEKFHLMEQAKFKLEEIRYFRDRIKEVFPNQKEVRFNFSAFAYASYSIFDYVLEIAQTEFKLNLGEKWLRSDFEGAAKKLGNEKALAFFSWWDGKYKLLHDKDVSPLGFILRKIRHDNTHHSTYKPEFMIMMQPKDKKDFEKPQIIHVEPIHGDLTSLDKIDLGLEISQKHYLEKINKIREEKEIPSVHEVSIKPFLQMKGLQQVEFILACEVWVTLLESFVKESEEKLRSLLD